MATRGLRRWLYRLPILLQHVGIRGVERVLGIDWLLLTTTGRRSGKPHVVILDVVGHDARSDAYYVQPADGRRADWVRNVAANPAVTAETGGRGARTVVGGKRPEPGAPSPSLGNTPTSSS